ncbi:MAG: protein kinase [Planctomycetes bacterium]|nr:protein kinase [Planctomycetota bacterium]
MSVARRSTEIPPLPAVQVRNLHGELQRPGLLALLRAAQELGLSGLLRVREAPDGPCAEIHYERGRLRYAADGERQGLPALARAILAERATFELISEAPRPARNLHLETAAVLEAIARVLIEAGIPVPTAGGQPAGEPRVGAVLGRCKLITEFAHGASSRIFLARHLAFHLDVVVKILDAQRAPDALLLAANEARVLAPLSHPGILRVFDFDDSGPHPYIVLEYVEGASLARRIKDRGALPWEPCCALFAQLAEALAYISEQAGLVHADIKPENVLIDSSERVRLIDFGLAGVPGRGDGLHAQLAERGTVIGTPAYIAPELVTEGVSRLDQRSDLYAFGATLYHALTGRPPFVDDDPLRLMVKRVTEAPPAPRELRPELPRALNELVLQCLAVDPAARPPNHRAVAERLRALAAPGHGGR